MPGEQRLVRSELMALEYADALVRIPPATNVEVVGSEDAHGFVEITFGGRSLRVHAEDLAHGTDLVSDAAP